MDGFVRVSAAIPQCSVAEQKNNAAEIIALCQRAEQRHWLAVFYRRFFANQFKRSCTPDAPKVGSVSLSPRGAWRMPSDAHVSSWLATMERRSTEIE